MRHDGGELAQSGEALVANDLGLCPLEVCVALPQVIEEPHVLDENGDLRGAALHQLHIVGAERLLAGSTDEQRSEVVLADHQGRGHQERRTERIHLGACTRGRVGERNRHDLALLQCAPRQRAVVERQRQRDGLGQALQFSFACARPSELELRFITRGA